MGDFDLLGAVQPDTGWFAVVGITEGSVRQVLVETREELDAQADKFVTQGRNVFYGVAKYATGDNRNAEPYGLKDFLDHGNLVDWINPIPLQKGKGADDLFSWRMIAQLLHKRKECDEKSIMNRTLLQFGNIVKTRQKN